MFRSSLFVLFAALAAPLCAQVVPLPLDLPNTPGPSLDQIEAGGRVAWMTGILPLGDRQRHNDFPSAAAAPNGDIWTVWSSYSGLREELHVRRFSKGHWYAATPIPGVSGDTWTPQVAMDAEGRPWFVWSQQTDYPGGDPERPNWDLYAARLDKDRWLGPIRLTDDPGSDIHHRLTADSSGKLWLVWQGFRDGQSEIFLRWYENGAWSEPQQVSHDAANDWAPSVAVDSTGGAAVVWDSYRNGNYDVLMRTFRGGAWGELTPVAQTAGGERLASALYDRDDRLWVAFEQTGVNWGKDTGGATLGVKQPGVRLGEHRTVRIKVLQNGNWVQPAQPPSSSLANGEDPNMFAPKLQLDPTGRVWLLFRHMASRFAYWTWAVDSEQTPNAAAPRVYWNTFVTFYDGDQWLTASELPRSRDRSSSTMAAAAAPNGQMWVFWHTDMRDDMQFHVPQEDQIWSCVLTPMKASEPSRFVPAEDPSLEKPPLDPLSERTDLETLRGERLAWNGQTYRLFKGDLHRHTELSTDGGGRVDGSILDFFRYMIDANGADFGAITDHSAGGDYEYWWWLLQKVTDMHHLPGRYVALFGYERTPHWPKGHKNVIHAVRNVPNVKLFTRPDMPEHWSTYAIQAGDLVDNDTLLLFDAVKKSQGLAIPHTLATSQGNDWTETDPDAQPVAEIFQGARAAYEHEGAPGAPKPSLPGTDHRGAIHPEGYIWRAWEKGVRIGVIASSDHSSTHLSHAMVYSSDASREGVLEAIRARRTYGATENILLEFSIGDHFMGEEFRAAATVPEIRVRVRGTAPVAKVSLIRNGQYITQQTPNSAEVSFAYRDMSPDKGENYYYVRVEQADGHLAWSSPIWVDLPN
ncbi:MAG: hypothetical protein GC160_06140 [Acidobacteria bacterium]|nr:hypothetical protein [Acidobacteriota bacterium]